MKVIYSICAKGLTILRYENDFRILGRNIIPEEMIIIKQIIDAMDPILKGEKVCQDTLMRKR